MIIVPSFYPVKLHHYDVDYWTFDIELPVSRQLRSCKAIKTAIFFQQSILNVISEMRLPLAAGEAKDPDEIFLLIIKASSQYF